MPGTTRRSPSSRRPSRVPAVGLILAILLSIVAAPAAPAQTPTAPSRLTGGYGDVLPGERDAVVAATERDISRYVLDVTVDEAVGTIGGSLAVTFVNRYGEPLDEIVFRLFPNAAHYGPGGTTVASVTVDGLPSEPALSVEDTVLSIPLAAPLRTGAEIAIAMTFTTAVPLDSTGSYGILSRSSATGGWALADWYPSLAGYEPAPGPGWRRDAPFDGVDPTFGDVALYDLTLDAAGMDVIATGSELPAGAGGEAIGATRIVAGPVRDLTLAIGGDWRLATRTVDGTVISYATAVNDDAAVAQVLDVVARSLAAYGDRFGVYPYRELDLVDVPLTSGTLGISWSGLIYLDGPSLAEGAGDAQFYDFLLSHEVAHQWWGNLVGGNSNDHTFIAEGLTNYTMTMEVEWSQGRPAAVAMLREYVAPRYLSLLRGDGDAVADTPYAQAPPGFGDIVYGKAALGFLAIRLEIGDDAFFAALRAFAAHPAGDGTGFRFRIAEPADLLAAFERASGRSLDALWSRWFEQAVTTPDEVEQVIAEYAAA